MKSQSWGLAGAAHLQLCSAHCGSISIFLLVVPSELTWTSHLLFRLLENIFHHSIGSFSEFFSFLFFFFFSEFLWVWRATAYPFFSTLFYPLRHPNHSLWHYPLAFSSLCFFWVKCILFIIWWSLWEGKSPPKHRSCLSFHHRFPNA